MLDLGAEKLEEEDQCMMELVRKMDSLEESSGESQQYWLLVVVAAREACGLRRREREKGEENMGGKQPGEGT